MFEMVLDKKLVEVNFDASNKEDVIKLLSGKMKKMGFVGSGFEEAVLQREKDYPTGLPTKIPVALCHVEAEYVNQTAMALATLSNPVKFHNMGDPKSELSVEIVFLLTILDPKKQVVYLRKMMEIFKDNTLDNIKKANSKEEIIRILVDKLLRVDERKKNDQEKIL